MKKILLMALMLMGCLTMTMAKKQAEIKFDKVTHNFGKFSEKTPVLEHTFTFTNVGDSPLVIHQAIPGCGCTIAEFTKTPVQPGEKGVVKVTYNGTGKQLGPFTKSVTVKANGKIDRVQLVIQGDMEE